MWWGSLHPPVEDSAKGAVPQNAERGSLVSLEESTDGQRSNGNSTAKPRKPHFQWLCVLKVNLNFIFPTFVSKKVQASGGSHMSSLMSSKGWVNALVFPPTGI